ncbi:MAG: DNA-methyltransferase [Treponema sp.]
MTINLVHQGDSIKLIKEVESNSVHLILSDIPYGISFDEWDVLHSNTNSALLGSSPAQEKVGTIFKKRGKPLNGWSEADRKMGEEYYNWVKSWVDDWYRVLKTGASAFVFSGRRFAHHVISAFEDVGFTFKDMIAWNKTKAPHRAQRVSLVYKRRGDELSTKEWEGWKLGNLRPTFEPILWFQKPYKIGGTLADNILENGVGAYNEDILTKYGQVANNLISISASSYDVGLHPTQKPLQLMKLLIELVTKEGQLVLDPFCGSGTTLLAAKLLKRQFIGIEKEASFCEIARKRVENAETKDLIS